MNSIVNVVAGNFLDAYFSIIDGVLTSGNTTTSAFGNTKELDLVTYTILSPTSSFLNGWPEKFDDRKPSEMYAVAFSDWILSGAKVMDPKLKILSPAASKFDSKREDLDAFELPESYSVFYGPRIQAQLDFVIDELKRSPDTRRAFISVLDGMNDNKLLEGLNDGSIERVEYPCTIGFHFSIQEGHLNLKCMMRSQNMVSVFPYDFYVSRCLLEHVADCIGAPVGTISGVISNCHVYSRDIERIEPILKKYSEEQYGEENA